MDKIISHKKELESIFQFYIQRLSDNGSYLKPRWMNLEIQLLLKLKGILIGDCSDWERIFEDTISFSEHKKAIKNVICHFF
jgi:hypothetical protein